MRHPVIVDPCAVTLAFIARYEFLAREVFANMPFAKVIIPSAVSFFFLLKNFSSAAAAEYAL